MILVIGEILFDVFDNYKKIGGAPFNFAVHLKNMSNTVKFFSRVGDDADGEEIINYIRTNNFSPDDIQIDKDNLTGLVKIYTDSEGIPDFDIIQNRAYDYLDFDSILKKIDLSQVEMIYFGTLIQRNIHNFRKLQNLLKEIDNNVFKFCDLNLRKDCYSNKTIIESLKHANILKLNMDEFIELQNVLQIERKFEESLFIIAKEYGIECIAVTNGNKESILFFKNKIFKKSPPVLTKCIDTVGAGDAFASILAQGLIQQWDPQEIIDKAINFSAQICNIEGAIPEKKEFYNNLSIQL